MLRTLYVRDYALIEELEVEFGSGLNIITGETGAGKSILLGALKMILGDRASTDVVRKGADAAVIEGVFDEADTPSLRALLEANELEAKGDHVILRRRITSSMSRAYVNDQPTTVGVLREIAAQLIDLHGQHEHQSLLRVETHLDLIDNFGGLGGLVEDYRGIYRKVEQLRRERTALVKREREISQQKELWEFQLKEIDAIDPQPGEEGELEAELNVLENAEHLHASTEGLYTLLYESEDALHDRLVVARNELQDLARIDAAFQEQLREVKSAQIAVGEVAQFLQQYNARIEFNPERLAEIRSRQLQLETLKRKYGPDLDAVLRHRDELRQQYELASNFRGAIDKLADSIRAEQRRLSDAARRLSAKRHEVAERVERGIQGELSALAMPHARFHVHFGQRDDERGWIALPVEGGQPHRVKALTTGMDEVEFYIATNLGEDPKPLKNVASGGEISRIMLALKAILAKSERLPILVFDEIDVGISGQVAGQVGQVMHDLAHYHQIIAITHLPQIAALGDVHFQVRKEVEGERTVTHIERLPNRRAQADAVARLISGDAVTEAARKSARELMAAGARVEG